MRSEREVKDEICRLVKTYTNGKDLRKDHVIQEVIKELRWVVDSNLDNDEIRKNELYESYKNLKGVQVAAFNAIRRYEAKAHVKVTLDDIKSEFFVSDYLHGFGKRCKSEVLANPKLYLY